MRPNTTERPRYMVCEECAEDEFSRDGKTWCWLIDGRRYCLKCALNLEKDSTEPPESPTTASRTT